MGKHSVVMGVGAVLIIVALLVARPGYYPGDVGRTISGWLPTLSLVMLGLVLVLVGTRMGDGK